MVEGVLDLKRGISAKATTVPLQGWTSGHKETDRTLTVTKEDSSKLVIKAEQGFKEKNDRKLFSLQGPHDKPHWPDTTYVFQ